MKWAYIIQIIQIIQIIEIIQIIQMIYLRCEKVTFVRDKSEEPGTPTDALKGEQECSETHKQYCCRSCNLIVL